LLFGKCLLPPFFNHAFNPSTEPTTLWESKHPLPRANSYKFDYIFVKNEQKNDQRKLLFGFILSPFFPFEISTIIFRPLQPLFFIYSKRF